MTGTGKVSAAATTARPYIQRALTDEEVRESVKSAFQAVRDVYGELLGDRKMTHLASRVVTDEDIQDNLRTALAELRNAADRLQGKQDAHRRGRFLVFIGLALVALFNPVTGPGTRKWIMSKVGGGGGDDYAYSTGNGSA